VAGVSGPVRSINRCAQDEPLTTGGDCWVWAGGLLGGAKLVAD
jgi:hypothetical protein